MDAAEANENWARKRCSSLWCIADRAGGSVASGWSCMSMHFWACDSSHWKMDFCFSLCMFLVASFLHSLSGNVGRHHQQAQTEERCYGDAFVAHQFMLSGYLNDWADVLLHNTFQAVRVVTSCMTVRAWRGGGRRWNNPSAESWSLDHCCVSVTLYPLIYRFHTYQNRTWPI